MVFWELKFTVVVSDIVVNISLVVVKIMMIIVFYSVSNMGWCVMMILA